MMNSMNEGSLQTTQLNEKTTRSFENFVDSKEHIYHLTTTLNINENRHCKENPNF